MGMEIKRMLATHTHMGRSSGCSGLAAPVPFRQTVVDGRCRGGAAGQPHPAGSGVAQPDTLVPAVAEPLIAGSPSLQSTFDVNAATHLRTIASTKGLGAIVAGTRMQELATDFPMIYAR